MCGSFLDFKFGDVLASTFIAHALKILSSTKEIYERHAFHKTLNPKPHASKVIVFSPHKTKENQYIKKEPHMKDK